MTELRTVTVKMRILGRMVSTSISPSDLAKLKEGNRKFAARKRSLREKASRALDRLSNEPTEGREQLLATAAEAIDHCCMTVESGERSSMVLGFIERASADLSWLLIVRHWDGCDDLWATQERWLGALTAHSIAGLERQHYSDESRRFFDRLPDPLKVYRGCSLPRVKGLAWTTDYAVAEGFARGHRGIRVPEPVVATALVPKQAIFFVTQDRNESEVVLDPSRLQKLAIRRFVELG